VYSCEYSSEADVKVFVAEYSSEADLIVANRLSEDLASVKEKLYTRDIYSRD